MTFMRILTTTSALALTAGPALADLTAEEVWADWKSLLESYGGQVSTASQDMSGDTLTVSGITALFDIEEGDMSLELGDITFTEQDDGSVVVTMPDTLPLVMDVSGQDGKQARVAFALNQPGASIVASGDTVNTRYDFDYPTMSMSDFDIEGDDVPEDMPMTIDLAASGLTGFIAFSGTDLRDYETQSTFESFALSMDIDDPEEGEGTFRFAMSDLQQTAQGTFPGIEMDMSLSELIQAGLRQTGTGTYGPSTFEFAFDGPDGTVDVAAAAEGGTLDMDFGEDGLSYGGITRGIAMTVAGSTIPLPPLSFSMEESEGRITMPVVPGDEEQDFGLVMSLVGLEIDDTLWNMFDPGEQLPREPATLVIDVSGSAIVTEDFTAPDYAEAPEAPPGTLESLDINSIQLKLAGAELTADGDFTFNNEAPMPQPSGTVSVMLTGGNTLLDTLVGMGLLPEDQAMGARMMLGLFARPGDGPDTLVSTIEVNEDGSVLANGQRIK